MLHIDNSWEERFWYVDQDFSLETNQKQVTESVNTPNKHTTTKIGHTTISSFCFGGGVSLNFLTVPQKMITFSDLGVEAERWKGCIKLVGYQLDEFPNHIKHEGVERGNQLLYSYPMLSTLRYRRKRLQ